MEIVLNSFYREGIDWTDVTKLKTNIWIVIQSFFLHQFSTIYRRHHRALSLSLPFLNRKNRITSIIAMII